MSLPFLNTAPGYDEELRNSVFFDRGLHATSICGAVGAAVAGAMLQGQDEAGIASAAGIAASMGAPPAGGQPHRRGRPTGPLRRGRGFRAGARRPAPAPRPPPPALPQGSPW